MKLEDDERNAPTVAMLDNRTVAFALVWDVDGLEPLQSKRFVHLEYVRARAVLRQ